MYFWIYTIFETVSQGNAATSVRCGGLYNTYFVENFVLSLAYQWKNLENRSIFREVIDMSMVSCFLAHSVYAAIANRFVL